MISGRGSQPGLAQLHGRLGDRPHLEREQARQRQAEADAAQAEHGVLLVHPLDGRQERDVRRVRLGRHGDLDRQLREVRQELVQRRVDEADGRRQPVHRLQQPGEVVALEREQGVERLTPGLVGVGQHEAFDVLATLPEELVLGAAQAHTLGTPRPGAARVVGGVGVGAHVHPAHVVGVPQHPVDGRDQRARLGVGRRREPGVQPVGDVDHHRGVHHRHLATEHLARGAVDGDGVPRAQHLAAHPDLAAGHVDVELLGADHGARAHPARDHRGVRRLAAAGGQHAVGDDHALQVVRVGLAADEDHVRAGRRCAPAPARCPARSRPRPRPGTPASPG